MRVKLDYNDLMDRIAGVLCEGESEIDENTYGILIGLQILESYIKQIAERSVELKDDALIGLLCDLHVIKKEE